MFVLCCLRKLSSQWNKLASREASKSLWPELEKENERKAGQYVSDGVYIVHRAPKCCLGQRSSLIHRSNALGSSPGGKSQNVLCWSLVSFNFYLALHSSFCETGITDEERGMFYFSFSFLFPMSPFHCFACPKLLVETLLSNAVVFNWNSSNMIIDYSRI